MVICSREPPYFAVWYSAIYMSTKRCRKLHQNSFKFWLVCNLLSHFWWAMMLWFCINEFDTMGIYCSMSGPSRLYIPNIGLIFRVRLTHLWSNFFYDSAFPYRLYYAILKVPEEIFGPSMLILGNFNMG